MRNCVVKLLASSRIAPNCSRNREILMGKVRVAAFGVSIDGFGAGPDQSLVHPLGKRGGELHNWFYPTRTFRSMLGQDGGTGRLQILRFRESKGHDSSARSGGLQGFCRFIRRRGARFPELWPRSRPDQTGAPRVVSQAAHFML